MSLKKINLLILISFFPIFIFRSNLSFVEIFVSIFIFLFPALLLNFFLFKKIYKYKNLFFIYLSTIFVISIDNNLGLWNGLIQPFRYKLMEYFGIIYYPGLFLLLILITLFYLILKFFDKKIQDVIIVFLITIFIFNIFDQTKSFTNIKDYSLENNNKTYNKTDVIIVFDEMSGLNSFESRTKEGREFDDLVTSFYEEFNFNFYSDVRSISGNSVSSISALLNFSTNENLRLDVTRSSKNYYYEYELNKNIFFSKFNNISVYQNIHIDYCVVKNITKCKTYNPFKQIKFLNGFKDTYFSKLISIWKLNGSIISTLTWRTFRELQLINSTLEPEGHKASFENLFNNLEIDIYSEKYDLIFVHTLVPHKPYGFNKKCEYDNKLSLNNSFYSIEKHIKQHNIERKCVFKFLENFLINLKTNNYIDKIKLTILSDHGSKIKRSDDSFLSIIYGYRDKDTIFKNISEKSISQKIFIERYN